MWVGYIGGGVLFAVGVLLIVVSVKQRRKDMMANVDPLLEEH